MSNSNHINHSNHINIALAGAGIVGSAFVKLLANAGDTILQRTGMRLVISHICVKNPNKSRDFDVSHMHIWEDAVEMASHADYDIFVELMGGADGAAFHAVEAAIKRGKKLVTANKALLSAHGLHMAELCDKHDSMLGYEAAVAGGIPIIKTIKEGLSGNRIHKVMGILNGTCNYILTQMVEHEMEFETALAQAQTLGYAEADPSFDIDGVDSAHKLSLLTALSFRVQPDYAQIYIEGIRNIARADIAYAKELGYKVKLLGIAELHEDGSIYQSVAPVMLEHHAPLANIDGVLNAVRVSGDYVGHIMLEGPGAGGNATASAVMADVIDIIMQRESPLFGCAYADLQPIQTPKLNAVQSQWYMRLSVIDQPGVVAQIATILRDHKISINSLIQHGHDPDERVDLIMVTHRMDRAMIEQAHGLITQLDSVAYATLPMQLLH